MSDRSVRVMLIGDVINEINDTQKLLSETYDIDLVLEHADCLSAGLESLSGNNIDLIVLNLLPVGNGFDALSEIKINFPHIPVIIFGEHETLGIKAISEGAYDYFSKGNINARSLIRSIRNAIEHYKDREALIESEYRLRTFFDSALDAIVVADDDGRFLDANPAAQHLFGLSKEEFLQKSVPDILLPSVDFESLWEEFRQKKWLRGELGIQRPDGETREIEFNAVADILPGHHLSVIRDVTNRKHAEKALANSEANYRQLVENALEGIWVIDAEAKTNLINAQMAKMLGYTMDEMMGRTIFEFICERDAAKIENKMNKSEKGIKGRHDIEFTRKDGTSLYTRLSWSPNIDENGRYIGSIAFAYDITEQRWIEAKLRQSQKLEAVGMLAGGIAHEFKNLLMGISGYSEILQMKLGSRHPQIGMTREILSCVDRASKLICQLLTFSRRQSINPIPIDINALAAESKQLIEQLIGKNIPISLNQRPPEKTVSADPGQIEQVLVNLAINARDAMPNGGRLTISTDERQIEYVDQARYPWVIPGSYVELIVSDTGIGMDMATMERIFEPFFTTKDKKNGSGLGLAVIYGIIRQHKGYIDVNSEIGVGTTFHIYLPTIESEAMEISDTKDATPIGGTETILLAEDEATVLLPARNLLEQYGYRVLSALDGEEALELFKQYSSEISLVVLDLIMPKLGGKDTYAAMRELKPDLKVLYTSGYADKKSSDASTNLQEASILIKPFQLTQLAARVRELLDT